MNAPHGERQQLELERRDAHQLGGVLVLAGGLPGAADPAVAQQPVGTEHDEDHRERQPVVRHLVEHAELQERRRVVEVDDGGRAVPLQVREVEQLDARRAGHVGDARGRAEPLGVAAR